MLGDVHKHFEIAAVYLTHAEGVPIPVTVRLHRKQMMDRLTAGDFGDSAAMLDIHDRIIFQKSQIPDVPEGVMPRSYVIFGPEEAYLTGASKPERETYLWVEVSEVSQSDLTSLIGELDLSDPAWAGVLT